MSNPSRTTKRTVKFLVNLITLVCAVILLVLVAATQSNSQSSYSTLAAINGCALNVGTSGVCAYAYVLGAIGCTVSLFIILLTLTACITHEDAAVIMDGSLHAFAALWWLIGVAVLGTFVAKANSRSYPHVQIRTGKIARIVDGGEGARIGIVLAALVNALVYMLSLWTNACCCIARGKNRPVSIYV